MEQLLGNAIGGKPTGLSCACAKFFSSSTMAFVIGVDVGGTNTDTVILHEGKVFAKAKTRTTEDKTGGVYNSIQAALGSLTGESRLQVLNNLAR